MRIAYWNIFLFYFIHLRIVFSWKNTPLYTHNGNYYNVVICAYCWLTFCLIGLTLSDRSCQRNELWLCDIVQKRAQEKLGECYIHFCIICSWCQLPKLFVLTFFLLLVSLYLNSFSSSLHTSLVFFYSWWTPWNFIQQPFNNTVTSLDFYKTATHTCVSSFLPLKFGLVFSL